MNDNFDFLESGKENFLNEFLKSDSMSVSFSNIVPDAVTIINAMWTILEKENKGVFNIDFIKYQSLSLINSFFKIANDRKKIGLPNVESSIYYRNFVKVEKIIRDNLTTSFPGIESISKDVNMYSTKLKTSFKLVYGVSLMQYHKEMKMLVAKQLLENTTMYINEIATAVGYENGSKFSASYKKQFGILPSAKG